MSAWRFRRCPRCRQVSPAGQLVALIYGPAWQHGTTLRACPTPGCGYRGKTSDFPVVREARVASRTA